MQEIVSTLKVIILNHTTNYIINEKGEDYSLEGSKSVSNSSRRTTDIHDDLKNDSDLIVSSSIPLKDKKSTSPQTYPLENSSSNVISDQNNTTIHYVNEKREDYSLEGSKSVSNSSRRTTDIHDDLKN